MCFGFQMEGVNENKRVKNFEHRVERGPWRAIAKNEVDEEVIQIKSSLLFFAMCIESWCISYYGEGDAS